MFVGYNAGGSSADITGEKETGIGYNALKVVTSGSQNTALGHNTLESCTTGQKNTAVGSVALDSLTTASQCTVIGQNAFQTLTTGDDNVGLGESAGANTTDGYRNTFVGAHAGHRNTTGYRNTCIGNIAMASYGQTGSNNTVIGYNAQLASDSTSNNIVLGDANISHLRCTQTSIVGLSDARDKTNIVDLTDGLDLVNSIKPRKFTWSMRTPSANDGKTEIGFIAQELDTAFGSKNDYVGIVDKENPDRLEVAPAKLIPILVKAIQELSTKVTALEGK